MSQGRDPRGLGKISRSVRELERHENSLILSCRPVLAFLCKRPQLTMKLCISLFSLFCVNHFPIFHLLGYVLLL
jgi:hypothetical protein